MATTEDEDEEAAYEAACSAAQDAALDVAYTTYDIAYDAIYGVWYNEARQLGGYDAIDAAVAAHDYADETAYELAHRAAYEAAIVAVNAAFATFGITCDTILADEIADDEASVRAHAARDRRQLSI